MVPGVRAWGFGGDRLAAEGVELREHIRDLSVMGIWEVLKRYGYFKKIFDALVREVRENPPDLILLVDYPGFNLRFAAAVKGLGIPVVQYVCPQVWAWKKSRIPKMAEVLDTLLCIFPFEPSVFDGVDLDVRYCGHPMVEETESVVADAGWQAEGPKLVIVPGSRAQEIERLFLPMLEAAEKVKEQVPTVQIRVSAADEERKAQMQGLLQGREAPGFQVGGMRELVKGADAALVTSGTATLETALLGIPMLVVYKTSAMTYAIGKRVVKVSFIGMVNLIAQREVCPEFIQDAAEPAVMAEALLPLLENTAARQTMLEGLAEVRQTLVSDEGGKRVAEVLMEHLND
jgi:lipid-A-disaccharide synthase